MIGFLEVSRVGIAAAFDERAARRFAKPADFIPRGTQVLGVDDAKRTHRRQGPALASGQLVDALSLDDRFPLLAVRKIDMVKERVVIAISGLARGDG